MTDQQIHFASPIELYHVVRTCWSHDTCVSEWSAENPCRNQCSVTALAFQHHFGGDILKTRTKGGTHFYNLVHGAKWDLATDQFDEPIPYEDLPSTTDEALSDATPERLKILLERIEQRVSAQ